MAYYNNDDVMQKLDEIANDIMNLSIRVNKIDDSIPKKNSEKITRSKYYVLSVESRINV